VSAERDVTGFSKNVNVKDIQSCVKCAELEVHLQQVLDELSSVQLIVQMLKNEHTEDNPSAMSTQRMEADLVVKRQY
jgi:hypothetical protein